MVDIEARERGVLPRPPQPAAQKSSGGLGSINMDLDDDVTRHSPKPSPKIPRPTVPKRKIVFIILGVIIAALIALGIGVTMWYQKALQPVSSDSQRVRVHIESGALPEDIAKTLQDKGVIRSQWAFRVLAKRNGTLHSLQAGEYLLSPSQSSQEILEIIAEGKIDSYNVTISPGLTLEEIKSHLVRDGFSAADVDTAFATQYDHPLLADKPDDTNLEGYIFPDTYQINSQTTVQQLLERSFDTLYGKITDQNLESAFAAHDLNMYQAVTLASIVQKEVSDSSTQRQVAQVFEKRLSIGMELGSDVTFMYAAKQTGRPATPDLESPYNTRIHKGLPPGPIANFNFSALQAVADPAEGDYLYFVAGDDGVTYFAHTVEEHEANVQEYCTTLCQ